jgi:hypothetical protein
MEKDHLLLSDEDFSKLEGWQLQQTLQQITGKMAVARARKRANSEAYHAYLDAKDDFSDLDKISTKVQSELRAMAALGG